MKKKRLGDLALAGSLLLLAGILFLLFRPGGQGAWAVVTAEIGRASCRARVWTYV